MPLKAVLFDMDGVIVDTEPLHRKAYFKMFNDLGIVVDEELYTTFTGSSTQSVMTRLVERFKFDESWEDLAAIKRNYFKHYFDTDPDFDLIPGVKDLIVHYFENGIKLVLASSAHMNTINWVFEKFDLEKFFIAKISGADLKESKPHPEIFELAAEMSGESKQNCMVIEDSTNGIKAANAAEIFVAAFASEHSKLQDYSTADILVYDFEDLRMDKISKYF
ncbi:HAD family phosphatase [uncultured Chryseobacterium sp.]|uniref:HAD family hydrolase n=1 Tax=uncultured Chryseobacterium sp. TaxID=259322 RepID=UPI002609E2DD|nr:HAD family phosphatase [uncultured Chryseobacterium sp.]